jgi:hypothetical protein
VSHYNPFVCQHPVCAWGQERYLAFSGGAAKHPSELMSDDVVGDGFGTGKLRTHDGGFLVKHTWTGSPPGQILIGEEGL